jgi:hypothetical protein
VKTLVTSSPGEARGILIIVVLIVSLGFGVWTYWSDLMQVIMPKPAVKSSLPVQTISQDKSPSLRISSPTPVQADVRASPVQSTLAKNKGDDGFKESKGEEPLLNLVNENTPPVEDVAGILPEKLNPIKVGQKIPSKAEERAKRMAEQAKKDIQTRTREFLQDSEIAGVRLAGKLSRLLFNGKVYQLGDTVGTDIKLKIQRMTSTEIIFEDEKGTAYPVHY